MDIVSHTNNTFVTIHLDSKVYTPWSRLQADCNFIEDLYRMHAQWKFLTSSGGLDLPIKTNLEIGTKLWLFIDENKLEPKNLSPNKEARWKKIIIPLLIESWWMLGLLKCDLP